MRTLLLASLALTITAAAQQQVPHTDYVQPRSTDIVLAGNRIKQDNVVCKGNGVYVQGQENHIGIHGNCEFVRVQGNLNTVWVEHETTVAVEGNENTTYFSDSKTRVSARGNGNQFLKVDGNKGPQ